MNMQEIEDCMINYMKSVQEAWQYEIKKEMSKQGISERKIIQYMDYLKNRGVIKRTSDEHSAALMYNTEYTKPIKVGKPCKLCEAFNNWLVGRPTN